MGLHFDIGPDHPFALAEKVRWTQAARDGLVFVAADGDGPALALLVLASRALGGRGRGGRLLVQTRLPDHEVVRAALQADPSLVAHAEAERRRLLRFPPFATIASVADQAAPEYVERLGQPIGVDVLGPEDGRWLLRAEDRRVLLDQLASVQRPPGRLRLHVDPARIR